MDKNNPYFQIFQKESVKEVGFCGNLPQNESAKVPKVSQKKLIR